jgi:diguanylate cyclase (GGDEF)-like protein
VRVDTPLKEKDLGGPLLAFDGGTAAFIATGIAAVSANGVFTLFWRDRRGYLRDWAAGYAFTAASILLLSSGDGSAVLPALLGNLAALAGTLRLQAGTRAFTGAPRRPIDPAVLGTFALTFLYFTFGMDSLRARVAASSFAQGLVLADAAVILLRSVTRATWPTRAVSGAAMLAFAAAHLTRSGAALLNALSGDLVRAHGELFVAAAVVLAASALGLSTMHAQSLQEQLARLARVDQLTGLLNRRSLEEAAQREVDRAVRSEEPLWVFMIDIDHFKKVNDRLGHQAGDRVLQQVAAALASTLRPYDALGRYGGEEFALVLPGVGSSAAVVIADRLRAAVKLAARGETRASAEVTASVGAAQLAEGEADWYAALGRADEAMYEAKRQGRDRSVVSAPQGGPPAPDRPALRRIK